ncbi:MAG: hypothetical protein JW778_06035 [Candidatus Altiarchaeota archaeon]|nr:hypothetical protein [Candidatus Altiarchaeota archaeon]
MDRRFLLAVLFLLFSGFCCAQNLGGIAEDFTLELDIPSGNISEGFEVNMYLVLGGDMDLFERMVYDSVNSGGLSMQSRVRFTEGNETIIRDVRINRIVLQDNETSLGELSSGTAMIVLFGGRTHNKITEEVYASGFIENESTKYMGQLIIGKGKLDNDSGLIAFSHKSTEKLEREAVKYSPLKDYMADEYVPVAATSIGMVLMGLVTIAKTVAEFLALDMGRKKKVFGHVGPKIFGVSLRELGAIVGAASVLGFAVTWTYIGPKIEFFQYIFLNSALCLFAALSHELSHRLMGRLFGIKIEYRFWYMGSFITIVTAFLGNSFGIQGFLLEKVDGEISKWKYAATKLAAPVISTIITVVFALLYHINPSIIFQMIYATASIWAMAEILPVRGLDGYDIRSWNRIVWFIFFIIISVVYFTVNFF